MRIAIVNQHPADVVGGSELQCDLVARGLAARGHTVDYVAVTTGSATVTPVGLPYGFSRVPPDPAAIVAACAASSADIVYWRMNRLGLDRVVEGLARSGIPLVLAVAHIDDVTPWPTRPWPTAGSLRDRAHDLRVRVRERSTWRAFDDVAAIVSQRADLLGRAPVRDQRVVRNLMAAEGYDFAWPRPYVAWIGSLQQRKRPELLPAIADAVAPAGADLLVAGEVREDRYRSLVESGLASPNLHHLGVVPQAEVIGLLAGARAVVVTAVEEGFANVLIQGWWHGTPAVTLSHDPDRLIAEHRLGAACDEDVPAFLAAVGAAAGERVDAAADRARIRTFARTEFDDGRALDALEATLVDVVARRRTV